MFHDKDIGALIILDGSPLSFPLLDRLWPPASPPKYPVICADGAANLLFDSLELGKAFKDRIPTHIVGDLDSVRDDVRARYAAEGTAIQEFPSQNNTDFHKAIAVALASRDNAGRPIVVIGGMGSQSRMDQQIGNLHELYKCAEKGLDVYWLSPANVLMMLTAGKHRIDVDASCEGPMCGLLPIGSAVQSVTTRGLKWDVTDQAMTFGLGGLVSTSNEIVEQFVSIETSQPLLWTCEMRCG